MAITRGASSRALAATPRPPAERGTPPDPVRHAAPGDSEIVLLDAHTDSTAVVEEAESSSGSVQDWRSRLIAAYAHDPWFADSANTSSLVLDEGIWYNESGRIVVPDLDDLRQQIMTDFHATPYAGHMGVNKTLKLVSRYYWWPGMGSQIDSNVRTCHSCLKNKARQNKL